MKTHFLLPLVFALALTGCAPKVAQAPPKGEEPTPTTTGGTETPPKPKEPPVTEVPAALKHEGWEYYGLDAGKNLPLEIRMSNRTEVYTGTQTAKLVRMEKGRAIYLIERTGGLAETLGDSQEVAVSDKGIFAISISGSPITPEQKELPDKLVPGTTWTSKSVFSLDSRKFSTDTVFKVVGPQKVKTKRGEFDAILVTQTGVNVSDGQKMRLEAKAWYVKGLGEVKVTLTSKSTTGETATIDVEATK